MKPRTLGFNVLIDGIPEPLEAVEFNVNGGYTVWNRLRTSAPKRDLKFLGIDLCGSATLARDQAINRSILPGTFISKIKGKQHG